MKKPIKILLWIMVLLLIATPVLAMGSANYAVDWLTPLSGTGVSASSTNFAVSLTVGQAQNGYQTSANYQSGFGFWYGQATGYSIFIPIASK